MSSPPPSSFSLLLQSLFSETGAEAASDKEVRASMYTIAATAKATVGAQPSQPLWMRKMPQSDAERVLMKYPAFDPVFMKI